jgi:hypothetical protein
MRRSGRSFPAAVLGIVCALAASAPASAAPGSPHGFTATGAPSKQASKKVGGIEVSLAADESYTGGETFPNPGCFTPEAGCTFFPPAVRSQFFLPREWRITTGRLANTPCLQSMLGTADATTARQVCSSSLVGTGSAIITVLTGNSFPGQVSAFVGGPRLILIHIDVPQEQNKRVLLGNLVGNSTLDVTVQPVAGTVIDDINLNIPKRKISKRGARRTKFFVGARCTDGAWDASQLTTFQGGSTSAGTPVEQKCQAKGGR